MEKTPPQSEQKPTPKQVEETFTPNYLDPIDELCPNILKDPEGYRKWIVKKYFSQ